MEAFLISLANILGVEKVEENDVLSTYQDWDSLTSLLIIVEIEEMFNVKVFAEDLATLNTIGDLTALIKTKMMT